MAVEVVSFPERLAGWDPERQHFYFELIGETSPVLDTSYGELAATKGSPASGGTTTRVFEYTWTIGHLGVSQHRLQARRRVRWPRQGKDAFSETRATAEKNFWAKLKDPAAEVFVLFPQSGGWRVNELGASMKYLTPLPDEETFADRVAKDAQLLQPVATAAGDLANVAAPGVGSVVAGSARLVGALAQMKLNSVPQTGAFPWSAATVVRVLQAQTMTGVAWSVPRRMFAELGGRISGSVAVIFVPVGEQDPVGAASEKANPKPRQLIAQVVVHSAKNEWAPVDKDGYIKLWISPTRPSA